MGRQRVLLVATSKTSELPCPLLPLIKIINRWIGTANFGKPLLSNFGVNIMHYLIFMLFLIVALVGLISLVFGLPGNFIILADSVLYGWYGGFREITLKVIMVLILLAILGEIIEFALGVLGVKKHRGSKVAIGGSIAGGIVGAICGAPFLFGIGSIAGAFLGAFAGAFLVEFFRGKGLDQAMESGRGAFFGRVGGTITKGAIGVVMIIITIVSVVRN